MSSKEESIKTSDDLKFPKKLRLSIFEQNIRKKREEEESRKRGSVYAKVEIVQSESFRQKRNSFHVKPSEVFKNQILKVKKSEEFSRRMSNYERKERQVEAVEREKLNVTEGENVRNLLDNLMRNRKESKEGNETIRETPKKINAEEHLEIMRNSVKKGSTDLKSEKDISKLNAEEHVFKMNEEKLKKEREFEMLRRESLKPKEINLTVVLDSLKKSNIKYEVIQRQPPGKLDGNHILSEMNKGTEERKPKICGTTASKNV